MLRLLSLRGGWRSWPLGGGSANWAGGNGISISSGRRGIDGGRDPRCRLLKILLLVFLFGVVCLGSSDGRFGPHKAVGYVPGQSGSVMVPGSRCLVLSEQEDLVAAAGRGTDWSFGWWLGVDSRPLLLAVEDCDGGSEVNYLGLGLIAAWCGEGYGGLLGQLSTGVVEGRQTGGWRLLAGVPKWMGGLFNSNWAWYSFGLPSARVSCLGLGLFLWAWILFIFYYYYVVRTLFPPGKEFIGSL